MRVCAALAVPLVLALAASKPAHAQLDPSGKWRTIRSSHFRVHFKPETEHLARRAIVDAESAYVALSGIMRAPRGSIDLVLSDDVDFSNGFASVSPNNRIVVYAHPPLDAGGSLRFYDDWLQLVITHELAHVFHLDRSRGIWRLGQYVFGRHPGLFPNSYSPRWFTEGLAVYLESRITGSGRLEGTDHRMVARAGLVEMGGVRGISELSLGRSRYPAGSVAYIHGSLLVEHVAETQKVELRRMIERSSASLLPIFLRPATGVNWSKAWDELTDSLRSELGEVGAPVAGWRPFSGGGYRITWPRWSGANRIIYAGDNGKRTPAAYAVSPADPSARPVRLGRRNTLDANTVLPDGRILFAQLEYTSPFHVRSDLWLQDGSDQRRLTSGARLMEPDVNARGEVVAVQGVTGALRLVRLSIDSASVMSEITRAAVDTSWVEPRWSPDGTRIVASRWRRGGFSAIVEVDPSNGTARVLRETRAVNSAPSWGADGRIYFMSDIGGSSQLYSLDPASPDGSLRRLSGAATGVFEPVVSPDGSTIAATHYRVTGYHLGVAPVPAEGLPMRAAAYDQATRVAAPGADSGTSKRYSPFPSVLPRYWEPRLEAATGGAYRIGARTSGYDVLHRHSWSAEALRHSAKGQWEGSGSYWYSGLGQPDVSLGYSLQRNHFGVADRGVRIGDLNQRVQSVSLGFSASRPRIRRSLSMSTGGSLQWIDYSTTPASLISRVDSSFRSVRRFPSVFVAAGFSNLQRPGLSISPEDGVSASASAQNMWLPGGGPSMSQRYVAELRAFKSVDLGAWAHHVIALRGAAGLTDNGARSPFSVGGGSGSSVELVPGYSIGGTRRTFPVRGHDAATVQGNRAIAASAEFRAPLLAPAHGLGPLPFFIDRVSAVAFYDMGSAWCAEGSTSPWCTATRPARALSSAGAEVQMDAAPRFDFIYRFRFGVARAMPGGWKAYVDFGSYF